MVNVPSKSTPTPEQIKADQADVYVKQVLAGKEGKERFVHDEEKAITGHTYFKFIVNRAKAGLSENDVVEAFRRRLEAKAPEKKGAWRIITAPETMSVEHRKGKVVISPKLQETAILIEEKLFEAVKRAAVVDMQPRH